MTVHFDTRLRRWRFDFWKDRVRHQDWCLDLNGDDVKTKTEAKAAQERFRAKLQTEADPKKGGRVGAHTLALAMDVYVGQLSPGRHSENQMVYVAELLRWFGPDQALADIEPRIDLYVTWAKKQPVKLWRGGNRDKATAKKNGDLWQTTDRTRSNATINRYLDCLRKGIRLYGEMRDPRTGKKRLVEIPKIPKLKEPHRIPRPVSDLDLARIVAEAAPWVVDAAQLARHMGFRRTEMLAIELEQIDFDRKAIWLRAEETKGNRDESVPANEIAMEILTRRHAEAVKLGIAWLFWYIPPSAKGKPAKAPRPIKSIKRAWAAAQRRAGLTRRLRFHDLKAAFLTAIAPHASPQDVQKLGRHKDFKTTLAYLAVAADSGRAAVDAMANSVREKVREQRGGSRQIEPLSPRRAIIGSKG